MLIELRNVLVLSPHQDDECLGLGGTLLKCKGLHVHYFSSVHPLVDQDVYNKEAEAVKKALECTTSYSAFMNTNKLHMYPIGNYITEIEELCQRFQPQVLFIPFPDYNQDHRVVYEAAITATRKHDKNYYVPNILAYEQPGTIQTHRFGTQFIPNIFIPINIKHKLNLWALYQSQQRGHRTPEHIKALAEVRGMQCDFTDAEAFMTVRQRWIVT